MGWLDPDALLNSMSSRLLAEWIAYYRIEPFGDELTDAHFAQLDAIMTSTKDKQQDPRKFRIWQAVQENPEFDPQAFFDGLKDVAMRFKE